MLLWLLVLDSNVWQEPTLPLPLREATSLKMEWSPYMGAVPGSWGLFVLSFDRDGCSVLWQTCAGEQNRGVSLHTGVVDVDLCDVSMWQDKAEERSLVCQAASACMILGAAQRSWFTHSGTPCDPWSAALISAELFCHVASHSSKATSPLFCECET